MNIIDSLSNSLSKIDSLSNSLSNKEYVFGWGSVIFLQIGSMIVHEHSHMAAASALFLDANPYMSFDFTRFRVDYNGTMQVPPNSTIGHALRRGIVDAAGPVSDITGIGLSSMIAWKSRNFNKKISLVFATNAWVGAMCLFLYSLQDLESKILMNDFSGMKVRLGIPRIIQSAITGSVTLGVTLLMKYIFYPMEVHGEKNF